MSDTPNRKQLAVAYILNQLSPNLRSDILLEGTVSSRYDIPRATRFRLGKDLSIDRKRLFDTLRGFVNQEAARIVIEKEGAEIDAKLIDEGEGRIAIECEENRWHFNHAGLLTRNTEERTRLLAIYLRENTLTRQLRDHICKIADQAEVSEDDFVEIETVLTTSPQAFSGQLREKLHKERITENDLIPQDVRYWDNLVAVCATSTTLSEFESGELAGQREFLLNANSKEAILPISLSFSSPTLVPHALFQKLKAEDVVTMIESLAECEDSFALIGSFEMCCGWIEKDQRLEQVGARVLERLFGSMDHLESSCRMFAALYIVATGYISSHQLLQARPAFWRHLACTAHASLVVRSSVVAETNDKDLLQWARTNRGKLFYVSSYLDRCDEPRWRPEWLNPKMLMADVVGRVEMALKSLTCPLPSEWTGRVDSVRKWIGEQGLQALQYFPTIVEGKRRDSQPKIATMGDIGRDFEKFSKSLSTNDFIELRTAVYLFGFPEELKESVMDFVRRFRKTSPNLEEDDSIAVINLCTHVAGELKHVLLSDEISELCLERIAESKVPISSIHVVFWLVECSAADEDRKLGLEKLARRLERLAFAISQEGLGDLIDSIEVLKLISPSLNLLLGRAAAIARLGLGMSQHSEV